MPLSHLSKASILALIITIIFTCWWEFYWRNRGFTVSYNDDKVLWAKKRSQVYQAPNLSTVFIGGSRIKFDLDIATWEHVTGENAVQLALVGTPARIILRDLSNDLNFKGKLIIDVAEAQFFSYDSVRRERLAREGLEYYAKETPAQKVSASIDYTLESKVIFLEEGRFGLTRLLNGLGLKNRPGIIIPGMFPLEFSQTTIDRQNFMTPMFLADSNLQKAQIEAWKLGIVITRKSPTIKGEALISFFKDYKTSIDKIRSRGGTVLFVRPPSTGVCLQSEKELFPREKYWDQLLAYTNTPGIHFSDYPELADFKCPERSHLSPGDAALFTNSLIKILHQEKGWAFPMANNLLR